MELYFLVESFSSCVEWVVALALIGVGAAPVRRANATAGYLTIGAGAVWLFAACCSYAPSLYYRFGTGSTDLDGLFWGTLFFSAIGVIAILGAAVVLARALQTEGGAR
jgi:hypothetical protein